ncbi:DUF6783 domain-containing protein [Anaerobutyricum hallii]|uniref:DUF6783 domain-containing protein n=1 Tax=Anaerobutyricum hallii TaxID=39488 RepID=UPI003FA42F7B
MFEKCFLQDVQIAGMIFQTRSNVLLELSHKINCEKGSQNTSYILFLPCLCI